MRKPPNNYDTTQATAFFFRVISSLGMGTSFRTTYQRMLVNGKPGPAFVLSHEAIQHIVTFLERNTCKR